MIRAIEGVDRHLYPSLFEQMFCMRATVFADRLGWNVTVVDGREVDQFDEHDPLYLFCIDEDNGSLKGAARLLPTTGPNMLRDVFSELVPDGPVESPLIWESSRFVINPEGANGLLLRTDIHKLFDLGYVSFDEDRKFIVSHRLKADFDNGKHYYDLHGTALSAPSIASAAPAAAALEWHRENRFLG